MKAIFYASSTGNTEEVANKIYKALNGFEIIDIAAEGIHKMIDCDSIIIGCPTWGDGELQDDWEDYYDDFKKIDFSNKTVALFGLGDQDNYADEFANAIGILHEVLSEKNANIIGHTSTDGYDFDFSESVVNDEFVGLVIDEDNQSEFTDERIESWCNTIKNKI